MGVLKGRLIYRERRAWALGGQLQKKLRFEAELIKLFFNQTVGGNHFALSADAAARV